MGRSRQTVTAQRKDARGHIAAIRAFYAGLVAEAYQHTHLLNGLSRSIEALRDERRAPQEQLAVVKACAREVSKLRRLPKPWRETVEDLHHSLARVRKLFERMAAAEPKPT